MVKCLPGDAVCKSTSIGLPGDAVSGEYPKSIWIGDWLAAIDYGDDKECQVKHGIGKQSGVKEKGWLRIIMKYGIKQVKHILRT